MLIVFLKMKFVKSIPLSLLSFFFSASSVLAQVATAPASPQATLAPIGGAGGATPSAGELPAAGFAAPTIILAALGVFFLLIGAYKFYQAIFRR